ILLPILFLFARSGNPPVGDKHEDEDEASPSTASEFKNLKRPICLLSTIVNQDPYLLDQRNLDCKHGLVQIHASLLEPYYRLEPSVSLQSTTTGMLYHPPSGLLF